MPPELKKPAAPAATTQAPPARIIGKPCAGPIRLAKREAGIKALPDRIILYAAEKWGKTSFAAQFPEPLFLMTRGEDGLLTLIKSGRLPWTAHFEEPVKDWSELKAVLNDLVVNADAYPQKTLVIDTLNGAERLCHEWVCRQKFDGEWGEKGFMAFHKGFDLAVGDWLELLQLLDEVRAKGKTVVALCHARVEAYKNPEGPDYDRYQPDVHKKTWSATHKWADMILFGQFETFVNTKAPKDAKGKADGGQARMLFTERHAAYDAGNRHGLPPEVEMGGTPEEAYAAFAKALSKQE